VISSVKTGNKYIFARVHHRLREMSNSHITRECPVQPTTGEHDNILHTVECSQRRAPGEFPDKLVHLTWVSTCIMFNMFKLCNPKTMLLVYSSVTGLPHTATFISTFYSLMKDNLYEMKSTIPTTNTCGLTPIHTVLWKPTFSINSEHLV
jgi:hypothetical protein